MVAPCTRRPRQASTTTRKCWLNSFARTTLRAMRYRRGQHAADDGSLIQACTPTHKRNKRTKMHYSNKPILSMPRCPSCTHGVVAAGVAVPRTFSGSVKEELVRRHLGSHRHSRRCFSRHGILCRSTQWFRHWADPHRRRRRHKAVIQRVKLHTV